MQFKKAKDGGEKLLEELEKVAREGMGEGRVVAFGEFGLDFDRLGHCGREVQETWFGRQLEVAVKVSLSFFSSFFSSFLVFYPVLRMEAAGLRGWIPLHTLFIISSSRLAHQRSLKWT